MELRWEKCCCLNLLSEPSSPKEWVDWGGKSSGFRPLCLCQSWSSSCYLLNVKGLIVFKEGTASTDASPCASLFFKTVWCLNTPCATTKLCQVLHMQRLLRELLHPCEILCSLLWQYWTPHGTVTSVCWPTGRLMLAQGPSMPRRDFSQA